jgi:hypothetical protein
MTVPNVKRIRLLDANERHGAYELVGTIEELRRYQETIARDGGLLLVSASHDPSCPFLVDAAATCLCEVTVTKRWLPVHIIPKDAT